MEILWEFPGTYVFNKKKNWSPNRKLPLKINHHTNLTIILNFKLSIDNTHLEKKNGNTKLANK